MSLRPSVKFDRDVGFNLGGRTDLGGSGVNLRRVMVTRAATTGPTAIPRIAAAASKLGEVIHPGRRGGGVRPAASAGVDLKAH